MKAIELTKSWDKENPERYYHSDEVDAKLKAISELSDKLINAELATDIVDLGKPLSHYELELYHKMGRRIKAALAGKE